jgi:hypothetical protein
LNLLHVYLIIKIFFYGMNLQWIILKVFLGVLCVRVVQRFFSWPSYLRG